jgi:hypothetical protein
LVEERDVEDDVELRRRRRRDLREGGERWRGVERAGRREGASWRRLRLRLR